MSARRHTVHVRVNDAATSQPTPVRIRFVGPNEEYLPPFGRLADFATDWGEEVGGNVRLGERRFAYIDGTCEVRLPPDPVRVIIHKGPEYLPLHQQVTLGPGKLTLRFAVQRWADLRREGWYSGDTAAFFLTPHDALVEGAAEDLAVVNLLVLERQPRRHRPASISNILAFSGQKPALEMPGHLVVVNTNNSHPALGSLGLLNCHRPIFPLRFGDWGRKDDWTLADWCDQCHRKGGLVVWRELRYWLSMIDPLKDGEVLADLVLGKVDALEVDWLGWCDSRHDVWYDLLNGGFRVPLVGCSDKTSNSTALGCVRTYARLQPGEELSYPAWIEAVRAGRTFVTNGPLLSFSVNGQEPGGTVQITPGQRKVHVRAEARSGLPFDHLEIVANGTVLARQEAAGIPTTAVLEADLEVPGPGWLAARCLGAFEVEVAQMRDEIAAHTSPVYVQFPDGPFAGDPEVRAKLRERVGRAAAWVDRHLCFDTEQRRQQMAGIFREAEQILAGRGAD